MLSLMATSCSFCIPSARIPIHTPLYVKGTLIRYSLIMQTHKVTPKDFFLWAGAMVGLYGSLTSFITLLFSYINQAFPDPLENWYGSGDPYSTSIRFAMASLLVLVPVTIILLQMIRRDIVSDSGKADLWVRRWALVLTLFLAGAAMVIDLIWLINYFLSGELTTRFILKASVVLLVAAAVFMHFLADFWGYWIQNPRKSLAIGVASGLLVLGTIVSGFFIIGSPATARLQRFDAAKVQDLQSLQYSIINYYQLKGVLPVAIQDVADPLSGVTVPKDPQTNQDYGYRVTKAPYSFELCATFNTDTLNNPSMVPGAAHMGMPEGGEAWTHVADQTCFERTIDPERYPLIPKGR